MSDDIKKEPLDHLKVRGEVIGMFANLEVMLDAIIGFEYVTKERYDSFVEDVLADEQFSFALRRNIFRKILQRRGWLDKPAQVLCEDLSRIGNLRNMFAHAAKLTVRDGKAGFLHPKEPGKLLDLDKIYDEFITRYRELDHGLFRFVIQMTPIYTTEDQREAALASYDAHCAHQAAERNTTGRGA
jgi:hypothetical protein